MRQKLWFFKIFRFSLFSLGGIFSFLGFFAFKNMKKMFFLIALLKNFLMRKQQNRIFHASKNAETLLSIVLVTGTCDFVIGDWCWCFGIANFGSPMIAWWRLSNLSSFVLALEHSQTQHPIHDVFFSKNISHFYAKIFHIFMQK